MKCGRNSTTEKSVSMLGKDVEMEPVITASRGQIEVPSVRPLDIVRGYRVTFDLKPTDDSLARVSITIFSTCKPDDACRMPSCPRAILRCGAECRATPYTLVLIS